MTGPFDRRILGWLAGFEPETCAAIAGLVTRAAAADAEPMRSGSDEDRAESARIPGTPAPLPPGWQLTMSQALCAAIAYCETNASEPSPGGDFPEQIGPCRALARQLGIEPAP